MLPRSIIHIFLLPLLFFWLVSCSSEKATRTQETQQGPLPSITPEQTDSGWVESTLKRMTLEEKIGQMIMPSSGGYFINEGSDEFQRLTRLVKEQKVGGLIFFRGNVFETAYLINKLQALADVPLLISADFERGLAMRIENTTSFPYIMALGATRDPKLSYEMGKVIAREGRALGVHQNYAPVVDVNNNPFNPVINVRAFGDNPQLVSEMADAFIRGMHEGKMISTAKHFPGHGDTDVDSHTDLPVLAFGRKRIESLELVPFRDAIERGVMSVMIAHLSLPAYDTVKGLPSTLSPNIVTKLLKTDLHFSGLVVTDAMTMNGVTKSFSTAEASTMAVKAGTDVVLMPPSEDVAVAALVGAAKRGEISLERIDDSVRKILRMKTWLGLHRNRFVNQDSIFAVVGAKEHQRLAKEIARKSLTLVKNGLNLIPLEKLGSRSIVSLVVSDGLSPTTGDRFNAQLRLRYPTAHTLRVDTRSNDEEYDSVFKALRKAELIVCPLYVRVRSGQGYIGLQPPQKNFLQRVLNLKKPVIAISLGDPYLLMDLKQVNSYLCAYSDADPSVDAAVEAIFGEIDIGGKLPITIPSLAEYGTGIELRKNQLRTDEPEAVGFDPKKLKALDDILLKAISDSSFPSAVLLVAKDGVIVYHKAFGTYDYSPSARRIDTGTMFDLASLTKVVATTSAAMKLVDEKKIALDDPVVKYLPAFGQNGKQQITIRNLLLHNSGLQGIKRFYLTCSNPSQLLDTLYSLPLIYRTGDSTVYSDPGIITLGKVVEKVSGTTLDRFAAREFFIPLHMENTMFNPPESRWSRIAPTEIDTVWRKQLSPVRGKVHDENAAVLGGVAGQAGLFSTASDLAVFMEMLMNGGTYAGKRYIQEATVRMFTRKQSNHSDRALGWDTKSNTGYSSAGKLFSPNSYGHTGFTGTSVWADPDRHLFVILLTNRVYPTRENTKIYRVRPAVHDAVIGALRQLTAN
jgi:beta-N-acetylhexosaminidase